MTKGIILAAGSGTRLSPATLPISKILLPVFDRPMIYYPLSTLISASIRDILIITNEKDANNFKHTLGDGSQFGINISYDIQYVQKGISDAFIIAEKWIGSDDVILILGDNILYGDSIELSIKEALKENKSAVLFGYRVPDPERFGIVELNDQLDIISLDEKPLCPKSNCAAIGLYYYKKDACSIAKTLKPSKRNELEITDLNNKYLEKNDLSIILLKNDVKWIDAGTFDSVLEASLFVSNEEKKKGKKILCPEITAYKKGFISKNKIIEWVKKNGNSDYYKTILEELDIK